jgi:hypothetical protein
MVNINIEHPPAKAVMIAVKLSFSKGLERSILVRLNPIITSVITDNK